LQKIGNTWQSPQLVTMSAFHYAESLLSLSGRMDPKSLDELSSYLMIPLVEVLLSSTFSKFSRWRTPRLANVCLNARFRGLSNDPSSYALDSKGHNR
jgi:hypothetical protein